MMIGGDKAVVAISTRSWTLAPGVGTIDTTPGREGRDPRVEERLYPCRPGRRGPFRQDGP